VVWTRRRDMQRERRAGGWRYNCGHVPYAQGAVDVAVREIPWGADKRGGPGRWPWTALRKTMSSDSSMRVRRV
jgi:hypothetical protein